MFKIKFSTVCQMGGQRLLDKFHFRFINKKNTKEVFLYLELVHETLRSGDDLRVGRRVA